MVKFMELFLQSLALHSSELLVGIIGIVGTVVGAKISAKASTRQDQVKALRDAYADVFAGYYSCMLDSSDKNAIALVTAVERTMLICSKESKEAMLEIFPILLAEPMDMQKLGIAIQQLREKAAKDVKKRQRN